MNERNKILGINKIIRNVNPINRKIRWTAFITLIRKRIINLNYKNISQYNADQSLSLFSLKLKFAVSLHLSTSLSQAKLISSLIVSLFIYFISYSLNIYL